MKEYEEFLRNILNKYNYDNPNNSINMYEMKGNDRNLIEKLKDEQLIKQVRYMGQKYVGFDLTYDAIHYFDERETSALSNLSMPEVKSKKYDVFLSHASKDKVDCVDELYISLSKLGIDIFYDKEELSWGDHWKDKIIESTHDSEYAMIVISDNFFGREWTEKEVKEFLEQENESGEKFILPILFKITNEDMAKHYPELGEIQTISLNNYTCDEIAFKFAEIYIKKLKGKLQNNN